MAHSLTDLRPQVPVCKRPIIKMEKMLIMIKWAQISMAQSHLTFREKERFSIGGMEPCTTMLTKGDSSHSTKFLTWIPSIFPITRQLFRNGQITHWMSTSETQAISGMKMRIIRHITLATISFIKTSRLVSLSLTDSSVKTRGLKNYRWGRVLTPTRGLMMDSMWLGHSLGISCLLSCSSGETTFMRECMVFQNTQKNNSISCKSNIINRWISENSCQIAW